MPSPSTHNKLNDLCMSLIPQPIGDIFKAKAPVFTEAGAYADKIRDAHGLPHNRWLISRLLELFAQLLNHKEESGKIAFTGGWLTHYVVDSIFCGHAGFALFQPDFKRFKTVHDMAEITIGENALADIDPARINIPPDYAFWDYFEEAIYRNMNRALEIEAIMAKGQGEIECGPLVKASMTDCIIGLVLLFRYSLILNSTVIDLPDSADDISQMYKSSRVILPETENIHLNKAAIKTANELSREFNCNNNKKWSDPLFPSGWLIKEKDLKSNDYRLFIKFKPDSGGNAINYDLKNKNCIFIRSKSLKDISYTADIFLDRIHARRYGLLEHKDMLSKWRGRFAYQGLPRTRDAEVISLAYGEWLEKSSSLPMFNSEVFNPIDMDDYIKFFYQSGMIKWSEDAKYWFKNKFKGIQDHYDCL